MQRKGGRTLKDQTRRKGEYRGEKVIFQSMVQCETSVWKVSMHAWESALRLPSVLAGHLKTSLCLTFLTCKTAVITVPAHRDSVRI